MSISDYYIFKKLGSGSFATVALAKRRSDNKDVAIKQVRIRQMNRLDRHEFRNEVAIMQGLEHPHIVSYYQSFEKNRYEFWIVMEYCEKGDLATYLTRRAYDNVPLSQDEIVRWFGQLASAVNFCHKRRILHRDIKAENVFLSSDEDCKLGDFGLARVLVTGDLAQTLVGTPVYASPELCQGQNYDSKSDIWALGVLLYEMMTFCIPFDGKNFRELRSRIITGNFIALPTKPYTNELRTLVTRMLSVNPEDRPSAAEILANPVLESSPFYTGSISASTAPRTSSISIESLARAQSSSSSLGDDGTSGPYAVISPYVVISKRKRHIRPPLSSVVSSIVASSVTSASPAASSALRTTATHVSPVASSALRTTAIHISRSSRAASTLVTARSTSKDASESGSDSDSESDSESDLDLYATARSTLPTTQSSTRGTSRSSSLFLKSCLRQVGSRASQPRSSGRTSWSSSSGDMTTSRRRSYFMTPRPSNFYSVRFTDSCKLNEMAKAVRSSRFGAMYSSASSSSSSD